MKLLNTFLAIIFIFSLGACKNNDDNDQFLLSIENLSGTHDLNFLIGLIETTVIVNGLPLTATTTIVGDTFQAEIIFNANGTYFIEGELRITTTTTGDGNTTTDTEIIVLNENGTFQVSLNNETITFSGAGQFFNGTFDVTLFNETEFRITQVESSILNDITIDSEFEYRFTRQ